MKLETGTRAQMENGLKIYSGTYRRNINVKKKIDCFDEKTLSNNLGLKRIVNGQLFYDLVVLQCE